MYLEKKTGCLCWANTKFSPKLRSLHRIMEQNNVKMVLAMILFFPSIIGKTQTCILIHSYHDTLVIGADSRAGVITSSISTKVNKEDTAYRADCKISKEKNIYYMASGKWAT